MVGHYIPAKGDLVWLQFSPQSGREQVGRRPGLVLTGADYNERSGLALVCPVTSKVKGYPYEVQLPADAPITGVILSDHVRSVDYRARDLEHVGTVPLDVVQDVFAKLKTLFDQ